MPGLFPCSWKNPMVRRQSQPRLLNAVCNLPVQQPKPTRLYLPLVIPADEICPLVAEDREIEQTVRQIQKEANYDYEPSQVLGMVDKFNHNLDGAIEKLNTTPPKEQPVLDPPALLDLMVCVSHYSHILEGVLIKCQGNNPNENP